MSRSTLADLVKPNATRTASLTMGLLALSATVAPAALAEEAPATEPPVTTADDATEQAAPEVLPAMTQTVVATGAHFGTGKLLPSLTAVDGAPAAQVIDPVGAELTVHFTHLEGVDEDVTGTCTVTVDAWCDLPAGSPLPGWTSPIGGTQALLPANSTFTLTLTGAPRSGQVLLDGATPVAGYTDGTAATGNTNPIGPSSTEVPLLVHGAYRTLAVQLNGPGPLAGNTFTLGTPLDAPTDGGPLQSDNDDAPAAPSAPITATTDASGRATFPGSYLPGDYQVVQTGAPAGGTVDPTARTLTVAVTTTVAARDEVALLQIGDPVAPPAVTPPPPAAPVVVPPAAAPAPAPAPAPAAPVTAAPVAPRVDVAKPTMAAGAQQTIRLGGFQPFEVVHGVLHSTPVDLGTVTADADGVATFVFTVPAGFETGEHTVSMTGATGTVKEATFTVVAAGPALAYTGTDVAPLAGLGGGLLLVGGAVLVLLRRRRAA
ncbi:prealbumin-like fold domain-containing protein [Modestobacter sp. L9-4]|uniref:prealbumin-like fold domain-containing protein n=1 Tax=Modestobacter sp. L9-4 TaxID=2851567 RepID=UPI001C75318E|nr:prealbumin-like fold domain-containing protein [Modestobacter sp. L9-4]QXG74701.1 prealbumin-like fold domain-containing protein [Modestobacter sp. L9-4]